MDGRIETVTQCDWSSLSLDLLDKIAKGITQNADYIRFSAVCNNWQSASPNPPTHLPCQVPWLMLPSMDNDTQYGGDFFSLSDNKVHHIDLPEARGERCFGSSQGWLCFVQENSLSLTLLNPLTKAQIQLPPVTTIPALRSYVQQDGSVCYTYKSKTRYCISKWSYTTESMLQNFFDKLILSDNPTSNSYAAMLICSRHHNMAFCRAGDDRWWAGTGHAKEQIGRGVAPASYEDGIFHKGQFYCVLKNGELIVYNATPCNPQENQLQDGLHLYDLKRRRNYLVDVAGELLMVITHKEESINNTGTKINFLVFKFEETSKEWIRVTSLGDYTLFLGMNSSFALLAKDSPKGCKPNCIYFSDHDNHENNYYPRVGESESAAYFVGIFHLGDDRLESLPCYSEESPLTLLERLAPPPIWITPTLC